MHDPRFPRRSRPAQTASLVTSLVLALLAAAACTETANPGGGAACTYRQQISCEGPDGCPGVRVCLDDLSGFGECSCGDAGNAGDAGDAG